MALLEREPLMRDVPCPRAELGRRVQHLLMTWIDASNRLSVYGEVGADAVVMFSATRTGFLEGRGGTTLTGSGRVTASARGARLELRCDAPSRWYAVVLTAAATLGFFRIRGRGRAIAPLTPEDIGPLVVVTGVVVGLVAFESQRQEKLWREVRHLFESHIEAALTPEQEVELDDLMREDAEGEAAIESDALAAAAGPSAPAADAGQIDSTPID